MSCPHFAKHLHADRTSVWWPLSTMRNKSALVYTPTLGIVSLKLREHDRHFNLSSTHRNPHVATMCLRQDGGQKQGKNIKFQGFNRHSNQVASQTEITFSQGSQATFARYGQPSGLAEPVRMDPTPKQDLAFASFPCQMSGNLPCFGYRARAQCPVYHWKLVPTSHRSTAKEHLGSCHWLTWSNMCWKGDRKSFIRKKNLFLVTSFPSSTVFWFSFCIIFSKNGSRHRAWHRNWTFHAPQMEPFRCFSNSQMMWIFPEIVSARRVLTSNVRVRVRRFFGLVLGMQSSGMQSSPDGSRPSTAGSCKNVTSVPQSALQKHPGQQLRLPRGKDVPRKTVQLALAEHLRSNEP